MLNATYLERKSDELTKKYNSNPVDEILPEIRAFVKECIEEREECGVAKDYETARLCEELAFYWTGRADLPHRKPSRIEVNI